MYSGIKNVLISSDSTGKEPQMITKPWASLWLDRALHAGVTSMKRNLKELSQYFKF